MHHVIDYRILVEPASGPIGTDFASSTQRLAAQVTAALGDGWEPLGGIEVAHPLGGGQPSLLQTMVRRRPRRDQPAREE